MAYREIGTGGSSSWMYVGNAIRMVRYTVDFGALLLI